jgi:hypothetical protein
VMTQVYIFNFMFIVLACDDLPILKVFGDLFCYDSLVSYPTSFLK